MASPTSVHQEGGGYTVDSLPEEYDNDDQRTPLLDTTARAGSHTQNVNDTITADSPRAFNTRWQTCIQWLVGKRILLEAAGKAITLFLFCLFGLAILLKTMLPPIDEEHKPDVKIPKSFDDLKRLNVVLQIYKDRNAGRVLGSYIAVYLFLQTFSVPGSMYLSILAGAMYGVLRALPLVCTCIATGATLCYLFSALLGPALLLANDKWRQRLELWRHRVLAQGGNVISYLIVLRIAPLPPHWMVNIIAPHLNISIPLFWTTTFVGVLAPSFIHVQVGTTLDQMTSPSEFQLMSWRNFFGLSGVVIAVMFPVVMRYIWTKELSEAAEDVVVVVDGNSEVEREGDTVRIVVHEGDNESGQGKKGRTSSVSRDSPGHRGRQQGWSALPDSALIKLPDGEEEEETSTSPAHNNGEVIVKLSPGAWILTRLGLRWSEGGVRM